MSLWDWYSQQQGWSLSQPALPTMGSFAWPTELGVQPSLQAGTCSLSGSLMPQLNSLANQGRCILAFRQQQGSPRSSGGVQDGKQQPHSNATVYLRLMLDLNTGEMHHECLD